MLSFFINEQPVDLSPDFSITLNFKSPMFNDIGSFTYPIKLPFTPRNASILNFKHRIENKGNPYQEFPCRIQFDCHSITGIFKCRISNVQNGYEGSVYLMNGDFYYGIKDLNLRKIDMGKLLFPDIATALTWINDSQSKYYPDVPCAFPYIFNEYYYDPVTTNDFQKYYNNHFGSGYNIVEYAPETIDKTIIIPFLYLRYVLDQIFLGLGYEFDDYVFSGDEELSRLILYNSASANNNKGWVYNCSFLDEIYFNFHVPDIKVSEFLSGLENFFNARFFVNSNTRRVSLKLLNDVIHDSLDIPFSKDVITRSVELEDQIFGYRVFMALDSADLMYEGLGNWDENIYKSGCGYAESLADLPSYPMALIGSFYYIGEEKEYYYMNSNKNWEKVFTIDITFTEMMIGDGSQSIETKFSPLWHDFTHYDDISACSYKSTDAYQPRIVFAKKLWGPGKWGMYSNCKSDHYSLLFSDINGLKYKFWDEYLKWRMGVKLIKSTVQLGVKDVFDFDFSRKVTMLGIRSLVKSIQVTVKQNNISSSLIEHYPCP